MNKIKKLINYLDQNIILILGGFLLAFIPLFPKIPLYSPIESYIVRIRLEDIFVLFTTIIWFIQVARKKVEINLKFFKLILAYGIVGLTSIMSALFIIKTLPLESIHVGKTLLHYFRYLEYFTLFFILYSAIKTKLDVKKILGVITITTLVIAFYGLGQRYYYWPVYSTMNREFSKGITLYLTEHARVQSTFAGHYDLGAWLVIVLPLLLTLAFKAKKKSVKIFAHLAHWLGLWLLVESAARSSFGAYVVAMTLVILIIALQKKKLIHKLIYFVTRYLFIGTMLLITMMYFGGSLAERLLQVVNSYPQISATYQVVDKAKQQMFDNSIGKSFSNIFPSANTPDNGISTDDAVQIIVSSDTRPVTKRPSDVYVNVPDIVQIATISATGESILVTIEKERTYSDNALKYGLSLAIRLDTLWPNAIKGFKRNPLIGSGYATLNKEALNVFTEIDGVDNNFLRTLGETGILGVLTFYGMILYAMSLAINSIRKYKDYLLQVLAIGYLSGTLGLFINATYIDVFAASKVAFTFWGLTGVFIAYFQIVQKHEIIKKDFTGKKSTKSKYKVRKPKVFKNSTTPKRRKKSK